MFPMPPSSSNTYQVQPEDRDLLTLAEKLKTDYPTLTGMNPSITSISTGQFIRVPQPAPTIPNPYGDVPAMSMNTNPAAAAPMGPVPPPSPSPVVPGVPAHAQPIQGNYLSNLNSPTSSLRGPHTVTPQNAVRLAFLKQNLANATDPSQFPPTLSASDVGLMGYTPAQMIQAGYQLSNGNWVLPGAAGAPGTTTSPQPTTNNNWMTNPSLHLIQFNKNAKNKKSTFVTTEKWARNAWQRKRGRGGHAVEIAPEPAAEVRADTPSTTLDLVLGT